LSAFVSTSVSAFEIPDVAGGLVDASLDAEAPGQLGADQHAAASGASLALAPILAQSGGTVQTIVGTISNTRSFDTGAGGCLSFFGTFLGCNPPPTAPPSGWQLLAYNDSVAGWHAAATANSGAFFTGVPFMWNQLTEAWS
jgi:hypothetical protein